METSRIDRSGKRKTANSGRTASSAGTRKTAPAAQAAKPFLQRLAVAETQLIKEELDTLLKQIDVQTKEVEKSLTFDSLNSYRELVRKFVGIVVNELYRVEERTSVSPSGRKKSLLLVQKIDQALDELGEHFLDRHSNMINFMSRLDYIRGLLLDMYS